MEQLFPSGLNEVVEKHTIPRILKKGERLDLYQKYYFPEFNQKFKCTTIESYDDFIFYFLKNDSFQYVLTYPVIYECYTFTLDKHNIMSRDIVQDTVHTYRGYQLKWWFYKHQTPRYQNFLPLVNTLDSDGVYKISSNYESGKYVDCEFILKYQRRE